LPGRVFFDFTLPADSLDPGAVPAQEARCPAVGNTVVSAPVSARNTSATVLEKPGSSVRGMRAWAEAEEVVHPGGENLGRAAFAAPDHPARGWWLPTNSRMIAATRSGHSTCGSWPAPSMMCSRLPLAVAWAARA
jgi:hypothetical protein